MILYVGELVVLSDHVPNSISYVDELAVLSDHVPNSICG